MKRKIIFALIFAMMLTLSGCGRSEKKKKPTSTTETAVSENQGENQNTEDEVDDNNLQIDEQSSADEQKSEESIEVPQGHIHSYTTSVVQVTCTKDGYTLNKCDCGNEKKSDIVKTNGHSYGGWETTKAATTKEKGKAERKCSICGAVDTKELAKLEKNHKHEYKKEVIESTCTTDGYTAYTCSCGDSYMDNITGKKLHVYQTKVTAPTCTTGGYTTYTCSCGDSYMMNFTEMIAHKYDNGAWKTAPTCTTGGR